MMQNEKLDSYFSSDAIFNAINKKFISLQDEDVKRTNRFLQQVLQALIERMRLKDSLFNKMYKNIIFCGSFYKGTKVGKPNEFDLNIVLELPVNYKHVNFNSERPAFVKISFGHPDIYNTKKYNQLTEKEKRSFKKCVVENFVDPNKIRAWIEGIVDKVIKDLSMCQNKYVLPIPGFEVEIRTKKSGPAFTMILKTLCEVKEIHIDLAPALAFPTDLIYSFTTKSCEFENCRNKTWFAIPVPISSNSNVAEDLHWRLSFSLQENEILTKYGRVKPIIRQIKRLRDEQNWKSIASYFIETVFLNKLSKHDSFEKNLNRTSSTLILYKMLQELHYAFECHEIKYFWNEEYNLLAKINRIVMYNIAQRLNNIIRDIESNITRDSFIVARYILNPNELPLLIMEVNNQQNSERNYSKDDLITDEVNEQPASTSRCTIL